MTRAWLVGAALAVGCGGGESAPQAGAPAGHEAHEAGPADWLAERERRAALASPERVPEGLNAVQNEMLLLESATRDIVTAIANDRLDAIPPLLHRVHGAKDLTGKAIAAGEWRPPRNPEGVEGFVAMDEAFHDELVKLLQAARADDLPAATRQLGVILDGCTACHRQYRF